MISIDGGANPGIAAWHGGSLVACGTAWDEAWRRHADILVIEKPTIYPHSNSRPNDIITLAITTGRLAERVNADTEHWYLPRQWKGQVPKAKKVEDYIIYKRVMLRLTPEEKEVMLFRYRTPSHDEVDAVGIGLYHLKRFH